MSVEKYQNKEWLYDQYCNQKKSSMTMAKECGISDSTILSWMKRFGIKARGYLERHKPRNRKKYTCRGWLFIQYILLEKSAVEIGELCECQNALIGNWLDRFNITKRNLSQAHITAIKTGRQKSWNKGSTRETDSRIAEGKKGKKSWAWKGKKIKRDGYVNEYKPKHPRACKGRVFEHILVMEKHLGRYLWNFEKVHHIDGNRSNNKLENLFLTNNHSDHQKIHASLQRIAYKLVQKGLIKFDGNKKEYYLEKENGT